MIFIRIKVKAWLKNISLNENTYFEAKGIRNKDKITYTCDKVKNIIKISNNGITLVREGDDFINTFVFNEKKSSSNYLLKDNNYNLVLGVKTIDMVINNECIKIRYMIEETKNIYEFKVEMSEIL